MSDSTTESPSAEPVHHLDRIHRAAPELHLHPVGLARGGVELEQADGALLLAERRPPHIEDVVQPLEFHGTVHAEVGAGTARAAPLRAATSTVTVPFCAAGSMRMTLPGMMPLRVSTDATWPMVRSRAWVSAMRSSALSRVGSATRARLVPGATCWPTSTGTCSRTPSMPARTRSLIHVVLAERDQRLAAGRYAPAGPSAGRGCCPRRP